MSKHRLKKLSKIFGPGIITGSSDDDPSGIATYTQAGAQYGSGVLWFALFLFPLMTTVQEMCGRIGLLTGSGLAGVIKKKYSKKDIMEKKESPENKAKESARSRKSSQDNKERFKKTSTR